MSDNVIDPVQCAEWLIGSSDKAREEGKDIGLGHAAGRVVAVEMLGLKQANADLLAACEFAEMVMDTAAMCGVGDLLPDTYRGTWAEAHTALRAVIDKANGRT